MTPLPPPLLAYVRSIYILSKTHYLTYQVLYFFLKHFVSMLAFCMLLCIISPWLHYFVCTSFLLVLEWPIIIVNLVVKFLEMLNIFAPHYHDYWLIMLQLKVYLILITWIMNVTRGKHYRWCMYLKQIEIKVRALKSWTIATLKNTWSVYVTDHKCCLLFVDRPHKCWMSHITWDQEGRWWCNSDNMGVISP